MNIPGVSFNNRNWLHVITVVRIWSCAAMAGMPLVALAVWTLAPGTWKQIALAVVLLMTLVGLFVPLVAAAKRYG